MRNVFKIILTNELLRIIFLLSFMIFIGSSLIFLVENSANNQFKTIFDGIWWTIVTMTTVGYGDKVPSTTAGKLVGFFVMFSGVILVSMFTATVSSIFVAKRIKEREGLEAVDFSEHIIICGWNKDTERMLKALNNLKEKIRIVLVNNLSPEKIDMLINSYRNLEIKFVRGDFTNESVLERANIKEAKIAVIVPDETLSVNPSDDKTLVATLNIKSLNPKVKVFAHIIDRENYSNLKKANADEIIISNDYIPTLLAQQIFSPGLVKVMTQIFGDEASMRIFRTKIPHEFVGKTYLDLFHHFKSTKNYLVLGFISEEEPISIESILSHDYTEIDAFIERKLKEAGIKISPEAVKLNLNPPLDYVITPRDEAIVMGKLT